MHDILLKIIQKKREELAVIGRLSSWGSGSAGDSRIKNDLDSGPPFAEATEGAQQARMTEQSVHFIDSFLLENSIGLIAEIKLASPNNPSLGSAADVLSRAKIYEESGANAISFITEKHFFKGDISYISQLKRTVGIPILQKDFVIDSYQIYESAKAGADAILLIARLVNTETLQSFVLLAKQLGVEPVVEINDQDDLKKAVTTDTAIIAVNARDLRTFTIDLDAACALMKKIPDTFIKLGFSGIHSSEEVKKYHTAGAKGVLVGTSLMQAGNITKHIIQLKNIKN
jgi:indole-3-glycerol phosphate synthase